MIIVKKHIQDIFKAYTSKQQDKETKDAFQAWLINGENQKEKEEHLNEIWLNSSTEADKSTWSALFRIKQYISARSTQKRIWIWRSVAASFIFVSTALAFLLAKSILEKPADLVEQYTPIAHINTTILPDGTVVRTNAKTTLLYPEEFKGDTRSVYLIGEALFKVAKDKDHPFIVKTSDLNITALGTEFNVVSYPEDAVISTTLLSGSIRVERAQMGFNKILEPNEQLIYSKGDHQITYDEIDPEIITAWTGGEITIQNKKLEDIFKILERHYAMKFHCNWPSLDKQSKYTFRFKRDASFMEVAEVIKTVANINYEVDNDLCYIY